MCVDQAQNQLAFLFTYFEARVFGIDIPGHHFQLVEQLEIVKERHRPRVGQHDADGFIELLQQILERIAAIQRFEVLDGFVEVPGAFVVAIDVQGFEKIDQLGVVHGQLGQFRGDVFQDVLGPQVAAENFQGVQQ